MARVIHNDLVIAQASAWHWWLAISPYNYKDGLVYISKSETDGVIEETKMLWILEIIAVLFPSDTSGISQR
ncbi:glycoside hydrolase [Lunatibacter salilacus]|uniref:glycoside hydrolase n=1 Tax=Lunatibacter salilacus TaxID=2483804 RepID=UPI00293BB344|nr:glycoside hydrolase [Lunatibacter salilacus]